jgi:glycosyltransferase involved in cell wall biosynthesis
MAMGVPAIAFAIPAIQELEAGTGSLLLVPPLNCDLLAEAILRLALRPDERTLVGEKGRALVLERFMIRKGMARALRKVTQLVEDRRLAQNGSEARAAAHTPMS